MPFLLTLLGIVVFFILVLSIRVTVLIEYKEYIELQIKWLFLKFNLLPLIEKQSDKKNEAQSEKDEKAKSEKTPEPETGLQTTDEKKAAKTTKKPPSLLKDLWNAHGYDGLVKMLKDSVDALNKFLGNTLKAIIIDELYYTMRVSKPDAAKTAIEYGKVCAELYPLFGSIISRLKTRKYDIDIYPDYIAYKNEMHLYIKLLVIPRKVLNAAIAFVVRLLFKVVLKVLIKLLRKPKKQSKI